MLLYIYIFIYIQDDVDTPAHLCYEFNTVKFMQGTKKCIVKRRLLRNEFH